MNAGSFYRETEKFIKEYSENYDKDLLVNNILEAYLSYAEQQIVYLDRRIESEDHKNIKNSSVLEEKRILTKVIEGLENANIGTIT